MEGLVAAHHGLQVLRRHGLGLAVYAAGDSVQRGSVGWGGQQLADDVAFHRLPDKQRLADALPAEQGHLAATLRQHAYQALPNEALDSFAHGCAANAHALGQLIFG